MRAIIDLPELQITALSILEAKRNTTRAQLVREAIEQYLKKEMLPNNDAFGAWQRAQSFADESDSSLAVVATAQTSRVRDGLEMQKALRAEWDR